MLIICSGCDTILFPVIRLKRLNGSEILVNPELIEWIESNPDTTLCLATGSKIIVKDPADEVVRKILEYRRQISSEGKSPTEILLKSYKKE